MLQNPLQLTPTLGIVTRRDERGEQVGTLHSGSSKAVVLNLWGIPTGGEWRSCQMGNDRSDSGTTASKFKPHIQMLTYFTNHNHLQTVLITKTTNI